MSKINMFEIECLKCNSKRVVVFSDLDYSLTFRCLDCDNKQSTK